MTLILLAIITALISTCIWLQRSRLRDQAALTKATGRILELTVQPIAQIPLTPRAPKAQDAPKRFSGPQLRRMADHVNANAFPVDRPNSEILEEIANG